MADNIETTKRIQAGVGLEPILFEVIENMRIAEDRPMSNMISILLKTHPRVQEILAAQAETAGAPA